MRILKQEIYFPIIIGIHFIFWAIDLNFYQGAFTEVSSDTLLFGVLKNESWANPHRILGEVFSSWVVTVFAFNFLMSTRAKWVERLFGGLDKMYLIHRRSGVIAVVLLLAHFIVVPRDLVAFTPGKPMGFYALVLILLGVMVSAHPFFKRKLPYHKWINIHKLMGLFYVLGVIHGLTVNSLIKELPITRVYVFGMAFMGIAAWFYRAFLFRFFNKKLAYTIDSVSNKDVGLTEIHLTPTAESLKYRAGQFAFFTFPTVSPKEQHPFTISSHPDDQKLRVTIKGLGDYTHQIDEKLQAGDTVFLEGPYGHFSTQFITERQQVWIAGGIGITPFLALAKNKNTANIHLYWCVGDKREAVYRDELQNIAATNDRFQFTIWSSKESGHFSLDKMPEQDFKKNGYLICGPQGLKKNIMSQLKDRGVSNRAIHDEEFAFR